MSRLDLIVPKLDRAEQHIAEVNAGFLRFFQSGAYVIRSKMDDDSRYVLYVDNVKPIPPNLTVVIGEALHCLRSALDYLAWQLVLVAGGQPTKQTAFPISDTASKFESELTRKLEGMSEVAIEAIRALRPYKTGDWYLWALNRLENIDKHRALITAGHTVTGQSIPRSAHEKMLKAFLIRRLPGEPIPDYQTMLGRPHFQNSSLINGDVIMALPTEEVDDHLHFEFNIAFAEPEICDGEPVIDTLHRFARVVRHVVSGFGPML